MSSNFNLKANLCYALREQSGLEQHRPYLGMSGIAQCPRKLYYEFLGGRKPPTDQQHWYCWTGYMHEAAVVRLIAGDAEARQAEIVAAFDDRFRGHVDHVFNDQVIEVKSVYWGKFCDIRASGHPQREHDYQVQMYLRHGGFEKAQVVYVARDVPHREFDGPPFWVFEVEPDEPLANRLDQKARDILAAIDQRVPPACECSWCRR